jgi:hypothetical protein
MAAGPAARVGTSSTRRGGRRSGESATRERAATPEPGLDGKFVSPAGRNPLTNRRRAVTVERELVQPANSLYSSRWGCRSRVARVAATGGLSRCSLAAVQFAVPATDSACGYGRDRAPALVVTRCPRPATGSRQARRERQ